MMVMMMGPQPSLPPQQETVLRFLMTLERSEARWGV